MAPPGHNCYRRLADADKKLLHGRRGRRTMECQSLLQNDDASCLMYLGLPLEEQSTNRASMLAVCRFFSALQRRKNNKPLRQQDIS